MLTVLTAVQEGPAPEDVKAGWVALIIFLLLAGAVALLGFELRWGLGRMVLVMLAGCVPFLSFWVEHRVSREASAQISGERVDADRVAA